MIVKKNTPVICFNLFIDISSLNAYIFRQISYSIHV